MSERFDLDNLNTAATRELNANVAFFTEAKAEIEKNTAAEAATLTKDALQAALSNLDVTYSTSASKADLAARYVKATVNASVPGGALRQLEREASRDRFLAQQLNGLLNASDKADEELRAIVNNHSGYAMFRNLTWKVGKAMTAQATGGWASQVLMAVNEGAELREVANSYLDKAFQRVRSSVTRALTSGAAANASNEDLFEAAAANAYIDAVMRALRPETVSTEGLMYS